MFNLAFLSDEIKEDKNKSTVIAKSISSYFCMETASFAAHQNASILTAVCQHREKLCRKEYGHFLLLTPWTGNGRVFLKGACTIFL